MLLEASGIAASVNPRALTRMAKLAGSRKPTCEETDANPGAEPRPALAVCCHALFQHPPPSLLRAFPHQFVRIGYHRSDVAAGEDPVVRQAAIDALGNMNGTVVAIEPTSGRVLAMVNQKLALSSGAQPCSTIKLSVALAALSEGVIDEGTQVSLGGRSRMNLTRR